MSAGGLYASDGGREENKKPLLSGSGGDIGGIQEKITDFRKNRNKSLDKQPNVV